MTTSWPGGKEPSQSDERKRIKCFNGPGKKGGKISWFGSLCTTLNQESIWGQSCSSFIIRLPNLKVRATGLPWSILRPTTSRTSRSSRCASRRSRTATRTWSSLVWKRNKRWGRDMMTLFSIKMFSQQHYNCKKNFLKGEDIWKNKLGSFSEP